MNILFLGNGFDLHHKLPTKYINFLHTVDFLLSQDVSKISTVGDVFSAEELRCRDKGISESYSNYAKFYENVPIDIKSLEQLYGLKNNLWFKYFSKSLKDDIKWIDFEKEIGKVIASFERFFMQKKSPDTNVKDINGDVEYIVDEFGFFLPPGKGEQASEKKQIKPEYLVETLIGSENKKLDETKIVKELFQQLNEFADALKIYLNCFVEKTVEKISIKKQGFPWKKAFDYVNHVINFNYTNTYELLYGTGDVSHIHGNVSAKIILGVNPDSSDSKETIDTTFLPFKKYFQRIKYKTDIDYFKFVENVSDYSYKALYVIGHSLDATDKDIIQEVFNMATKIYILSYDEIDESDHITNLIKIFGKSEFDKLRRAKDITFMWLSDDLDSLMKSHDDIEIHKRFFPIIP